MQSLKELTDLILRDNDLSDVHTGSVLPALTKLQVLDIRGNAPIFDAVRWNTTFALDTRRVPRNIHALRKLEQAGCVVLVDDTALRAPSCPCCK